MKRAKEGKRRSRGSRRSRVGNALLRKGLKPTRDLGTSIDLTRFLVEILSDASL